MAFTTVKTTVEKNVGFITFCRPKSLNSFTRAQYQDVTKAVGMHDNDPNVRVIVITGQGRLFSSGHDLAEQGAPVPEGTTKREVLLLNSGYNAGALMPALLDARKPIIAGVNGPAIGIACTMLGVMDVVYASEASYFLTPFMKLGFCAEGCSSVTFPEIMGRSKANEMLLLGRKLSAVEAERVGFVAALFPNDRFAEELRARAFEMAAFPSEALQKTKSLGLDLPIGDSKFTRRQHLKQVNEIELEELVDRMLSAESIAAVEQFNQEAAAKRAAKKLKQQHSKL